MIWREIKSPINGTILIALILAGPWLHHDKVICIQADSHVRVERVGAGCCSQDLTEAATGLFSSSLADDDCGSCLDLHFAQEAARLTQCAQAAQSVRSTNGPILAG
ncbi:MAG: hypothetical protein NTW07_01610, partial [candidate division Zixibacteria bacterium]|nr:hypothetical protein [candidate division Zixibacteria bacterium]